ncbi:MAG: cytochrome P450 [Gammaproteobacteria bacterium]|nr:cytochrome P450 [Gammaproteobacteria bacterium]
MNDTHHANDRLDILGPGSHRDPYPYFARLRDSQPVHWLEGEKLWLVTRHADVVDVLRRVEDFSAVANERQEPEAGERRGTPNIITLDRPDHDRLRQVLQKRFTNRGLARYQTRIEALATELASHLGTQDEFDLVSDFTVPLPVTTIAEALGIELERYDDFKRWSDALVRIITVRRESPEWYEARDSLHELIQYFRMIADSRRETPTDDLVGALVEAESEPGRISEREIISYCLLLLAAGNETTTNLIGGMVVELFKNPEQFQLLLDEPERLPAAIEEGLRHCSPVQVLFRRTLHETKIGDVVVPANQDIGVSYAAANRDESVFVDPDRFDITRDTTNHVAFGYGLHHCLGAHLARREATAAFERLLPLLPKMQRSYDEVTWVDSWVVRGPKSLPMHWAA